MRKYDDEFKRENVRTIMAAEGGASVSRETGVERFGSLKECCRYPVNILCRVAGG